MLPLVLPVTSVVTLRGEEMSHELFWVHEIAHHFGIDDERLHELGWG
ncbi:metallopeptidase family protein [Longimycelium tulufanense]|nr:metallopeptidase family protein [Longimycelium tulufanense]